MAQQYRIFKRAAWKRNPQWHGGWEPHPTAKKSTVKYTEDINEAREICNEHNSQRKSKGDLFMEFEQC